AAGGTRAPPAGARRTTVSAAGAPHQSRRSRPTPPDAGGSARRGDVAVDAEEIVRIERGCGGLEALVAPAVRGGGARGVVLGQLEVDVVAAGREPPDALPRRAHPGDGLVVRDARWPDAGEAADELRIAISNRAIVLVALVQRAADVEDDRVRERSGQLQGAVPKRAQELGGQARQVLGLPVLVQPSGLHVVQQRLLIDMEPRGLHQYWKAEYLAGLPPEFLGTFGDCALKLTTPLSYSVIFHIGGALKQRDEDDGAVGNRDAQFISGFSGVWPPGVPDDEPVAWVRASWERIRRFSTGGNYVNFQLAEDDATRTAAAYGRSYQRLQPATAAFD